MHLIVTRDHSAAVERIRRNARIHFGKEPVYKGSSLPELLSSMPILNKDDLILYGERHADQYLSEAILFSETSGTTSIPLQTPRSKLDLGWNVINQISAYKALVRPGIDRVALLHPSVLSPFVEGAALALQNLGVGYVRIFPIPGVCEYRRIYDVLQRYRITAIMSTPALVYKLLYELKSVGNGALPRSLKTILATGERFRPESARNMERIIGPGSMAIPFVYGSSETAVIMIGNPDCSYRPVTEDFVFEILSTGAASPDHIRGNLLVTWLREGMLPILRYDTGDTFTASRVGTEEDYVFRFEGRTAPGSMDIQEQNTVESALYSLSVPIFHFECSVASSRRQLRCIVITEPSAQLSADEVETALTFALNKDWQLHVEINPATHSFLNFSPFPKIRRFKIA
ncbi:AMP-binding protein [Pseudothauera rhizosphaerae]|uniref:CoF synthetase n=1 Tax=Pseudothauera rhizosphaerae TaxID=2565932 RepID=A0A4S4ABE3_9RHOO|nr:AMP-binding protein [Pseudothauera rhizosphaerae]THF56232.1 CoF synthetase [Pseudothauera rhizosphaerae]